MRASFCSVVSSATLREPNLRRDASGAFPRRSRSATSRFLWSAILSMRFAENMIAVAVGWQVYAIHKDPLDLGLIGLAEFVPLPLLALPAGPPRRPRAAPADRGVLAGDDGRRRARCCSPSRSRTRASSGRTSLLAAPTGVASAIGWPAWTGADARGRPGRPRPGRGRAAVGGEHDRGDRRAGGRRPALRVAARGGLRLGGRRSSPSPACRWPRCASGRVRADGEAVGLAGLVDGVRFVWRTRMLLGAITLDLFAVLLGGGVALLPIYARDILHVGPVGLGVLRAAPAVGAFVGALILARRPLRRAGRSDADRRRRPLRRAEHRLGRLEVAAAHAGGARGRRLRRHDQREHPLDDGRAGHAERAARPGRRRRDGLHLRVERARRLRVGRGRRASSAPSRRSSPAASRRSGSRSRRSRSSRRSRGWASSRTSGPSPRVVSRHERRPPQRLAVRGRSSPASSSTRATRTRRASRRSGRSARLEGGQALLFSSGSAAAHGAPARAARAGADGRPRRGRLLRHGVLMRDVLDRWGLEMVEFDQTGAAAGRRRPDLAGGAVEPVPDDARPRRCRRPPGPGRRRLDRATPVYLRPLEHGADFVLHSATKYLTGHSDALAGASSARDQADYDRLWHFRQRTGPICSADARRSSRAG